MALPAGISTATVTVGVPVTFSGGAVRSIVTITPSAFLVHTATGHPLVNMIEEVSTTDGVAAQFTLPVTDQDGFQDENGNAYKNWYYTASIQYVTDKATKPAFTKVFQLVTGQSVVDLDLLPSGNPAIPYTAPIATVTSVNGQTGAIVVEGATDEAVAEQVTSGTQTVAALSATYAKPLANSVILFGTSLEHQNQGGTDTKDPDGTTTIPVNGRGWYHWANAFSGGHMNLIRNAGIQGNTYAQMLSRIDADVLAHASDWVFLGGPVNDISQNSGRPAADIIADATAILDKLKGRRVLMLTAAPSSSYDTLSKRQALAAVNAWICDLPKSRPNVIVVDAWRVLVDPATGNPATGMTIDGIVHYSYSGAARIGKAVSDAVKPWLASSPPKVSYANDPKSVIANPNFLTNGSGWATTASVTASYTADENTFGNKAVLTFSGNTGTGDLGITFTELFTAGRFAVGDVIQLSARIEWANLVPVGVASKIHPVVRVRQFDNNNTFLSNSQAIALLDSASNAIIPAGFPASGEAVVRTHKVTIQNPAAGMKSLSYLLGFVGMASGTVTIRDFNATKV